ncbi:AEC family transporter [Microbacterium sp. GCS4]|uniref:AEC family transporter n=1 Tax=Microbacterium sp. GCS4 TaxID=1692239 RepID=UPI0006809A4C|nr:AEC family transporter [Microbacterium sp. GCS4]KNY07361.1 auxin efflux carrier [Microbacterium sp. GCS4]
MPLALTAILPVVVLLVIGWILRHRAPLDPSFWRGLEWMSYRVFTPALFVTSIGRADLGAVPIGPLAVALTIPVLLVLGILLGAARLLRITGARLTSLVQGSVRVNTYLGLMFATALHGEEGIATYAIASAVMVPLVNVVCVSALARWGDGVEETRPRFGRELVTNPLIQGCVIGIVVNVSGLRLDGPVATVLDLLAAPALVTGTLIAGAALTLAFRRRDLLDIGIAVLLKLLVLPALAVLVAAALGIEDVVLSAVVVIAAVPTAPSAYVLARRMGGDHRLMASITGVQTVAALVTVPLALAVLEVVTTR